MPSAMLKKVVIMQASKLNVFRRLSDGFKNMNRAKVSKRELFAGGTKHCSHSETMDIKDKQTKCGVGDEEKYFRLKLNSDVKVEQNNHNDSKTKRNKGYKLNDDKSNLKIHPNCFLSIPILNDQVKAKFNDIQGKMTEIEPKLASVMISVPTIHLTFKVYSLKEENELNRARKAMDDAKDEIIKTLQPLSPVKIDISCLDSFGNEVIFAKVSPSPQLDSVTRIGEILEKSFRENGLESTDSRPFKPHITLLKLSRGNPKLRKSLEKLTPELCSKFRDEKLGSEIISRIDLCSMTAPKGPDGYYQILHQIKLLSIN